MLATGNNYYGQCNVSDWKNVAGLAAGREFSLGITTDGRILAAGNNYYGQLDLPAPGEFQDVIESDPRTMAEALAEWTDIRDVWLYSYIDPNDPTDFDDISVLGLKSDGSLVIWGGISPDCDISGWTGLSRVVASSRTVIGLRPDGHVLAVGSNEYGQCDVDDWTDVVDVLAGSSWTAAITENGDFLFAGYPEYDPLTWLEFDGLEVPGVRRDGQVLSHSFDMLSTAIREDRGVTPPGVVAIEAGRNNLVQLFEDGSVRVIGENRFGQCDVDGWTGITAVAVGYGHTVGLREDGTVLAIGCNDCGQCDVGDWTGVRKIVAGNFFTLGVTEDGRVLCAGE